MDDDDFVDEINTMLATNMHNGRKTRVGRMLFKSQLEAKWWRVFTSTAGVFPTYELFAYASTSAGPDGYGASAHYRPDFVLFESNMARRQARGSHDAARRPHIEVKPTQHEPTNLMWAYKGPVVQVCGYPDSRPSFYVVTWDVVTGIRGRRITTTHTMVRHKMPSLVDALVAVDPRRSKHWLKCVFDK